MSTRIPSKVTYRHHDRQLACQNSRFDVYFDSVELANGQNVPDFMVVRPRVQDKAGIAGVLILPEVSGQVGLMHCYRHQFARAFWQAPAGFMEPGETAVECALRELHEETGLTCPPSSIVSLGNMAPDAGLIEGLVAMFVARCPDDMDTDVIDPEFGTDKLEFFSPEGLNDLILNCGDVGAATVVAGFRYLNFRTHNL